MSAVIMKRVDQAQNMARFYEIDVQPTLFGDYVVQRHWGRIGTAGQFKTFWHSSEDQADQMANNVAHVKMRRGYRPVPPLF
jgi:predicted DNA-binding WGR domain protein